MLRENRSAVKLNLFFPILVTLVIGGATILRALRTEQAIDILIAGETWTFILVILGWAVFGSPAGPGARSPIRRWRRRRCILRREANLRGATFGACLYGFQLAFLVIALGAASPAIAPVLTSINVIVAGWIGAPVGLAVLYWFRRRQRADLERLHELKRQLQSD